ncbi:hypothetical protein ESA94_14280 [Lacibacter luteus]|uniref:Uncharacterized protein n=1 Tax=Lacibacter luteus TaxID=2508719 RepID=A0A4Q1CHK5_9BACT|nr:hypothetical protein ESA94_14280 [Lacibacter luteus]
MIKCSCSDHVCKYRC